ncbi:MAG: hypothetical protein AcusKO_27800 [Acuticoccus sp.]
MPVGGGTVAAQVLPPAKPDGRTTTRPSPQRAAPREPGRTGGFLGKLFGGKGGGGGGGAGGDARKAALLAAYPGAFRFEGNTIVFPSGARIVWDDGRRKSPAALLADADVQDMFAYPYRPARHGEERPKVNHDPGRVRDDAFFKELYGGSAGAVRQNLATVAWVPRLGGGQVAVTTRFGVDRKIAAISADLERLPPRFHKYLRPTAGTFNWRPIAGTNRLSVHSYGAAIDINTHFANYWRWDKQPESGALLYRNEIPIEIVEVFERHCFIWGGRWYHYDTMHFEYRPELLPNCRK